MIDHSRSLLTRPFPYDRPPCSRTIGHRPAPSSLHRRHLLQGLAAGGLLGLAGCAGADATAGPTASAEREVEVDNGPVTVPNNPERVVVTDNYLISTLYDLGLLPIGIPDGQLQANIFPDEILEWVGEPAEIGPSGSPASEAVLALDPDLILDQFYPDQTKALADVAPLVFIDWRKSGRTWQEQVKLVATVVNRQEQLAEKEERYADALEKIRTRYGDVLKQNTWAFAAGGQGGDWILGSTAVAVLTDLQATLLPDLTSTFVSHSLEELDLLQQADVILYPELFDGSVPAPTATLHTIPLWRALPAVKAEHTYPMSYSAVSCHHWAIQALGEIDKILADMTGKA